MIPHEMKKMVRTNCLEFINAAIFAQIEFYWDVFSHM